MCLELKYKVSHHVVSHYAMYICVHVKLFLGLIFSVFYSRFGEIFEECLFVLIKNAVFKDYMKSTNICFINLLTTSWI